MNNPEVNAPDPEQEKTEVGGCCGVRQQQCRAEENTALDAADESTEISAKAPEKEAPAKEAQPKEAPEKEAKFTEKAEKGHKGVLAWKKVTQGGVTGIALGTAAVLISTPAQGSAPGTYATGTIGELILEHGSEDEASPFASLVDPEVAWATGTNDDMSFSEAFGAARAEVGPGGVFEWRGQLYGTFTEQEWDAMTPEERQDYNNHFAWSDASSVEVEPQADFAQETTDEIEIQPQAGEEEIAQAETEIEAEATSEVETSSEAENEAPAETVAEVAVETETETPSQSVAEETAETTTEAEATVETEPEAEAETASVTETEVELEPEAEVEIEVSADDNNEVELVDETGVGEEEPVNVNPIDPAANNQFEYAGNTNPIEGMDEVPDQSELEIVVENNSEVSGNFFADNVSADEQPLDIVDPMNDVAEAEVEILGIYQDDNGMTVGGMSFDGQEVLLIDVESDGEFDLAAIDMNHDGHIDMDEIFDINELGMDDGLMADQPDDIMGMDGNEFLDPGLDNDDVFMA